MANKNEKELADDMYRQLYRRHVSSRQFLLPTKGKETMCFNLYEEARTIVRTLNSGKPADIFELENAVLEEAKDSHIQVPVIQVVEMLLEQNLIQGSKWLGYRLAKQPKQTSNSIPSEHSQETNPKGTGEELNTASRAQLCAQP